DDKRNGSDAGEAKAQPLSAVKRMHGEFLGSMVSATPAQRPIRASNDHDVVIIDRRFDFCNEAALSE
ncbi:MAG TPA: hypothetical protein VGT81_20765, partial [Casimicrobiaceae bacterium]|nr:hypothetical protein [Casimicrobiaceae bacterium]